MTHPLVFAFHRKDYLLDALSDYEVTGRQRREAAEEWNAGEELIDEVIASTPCVQFSVGFFCGANRRVFFIWLWPLNALPEWPDTHWRYFPDESVHDFHLDYELAPCYNIGPDYVLA